VHFETSAEGRPWLLSRVQSTSKEQKYFEDEQKRLRKSWFTIRGEKDKYADKIGKKVKMRRS